MTMHDLGVPAVFLRWIRGFLLNRQARVSYNDTLGRTRRIRQGLPQGSVLSPLLFLFYINSVSEKIPRSVNCAMYADDVSLWASHRCKESATADIQRAVDSVSEWSRKKKMVLNTEKSEVAFFSTDTREANWQPTIWLNGKSVPFNGSPRLLGVHMDRTLTFSHHTETVCKKATSRCRVLACLATKEWGWQKNTMKKVYISLIRSCLDFAAPAWQPWLSATRFQCLEATQNKALRIMTGQAKTTPVEALRAEAGVCSYKTVSNRLCVRAHEKAIRLPADHPKNLALCGNNQHRLQRSSWREQASCLLDSLPSELRDRQALSLLQTPPWISHAGRWHVYTDIQGGGRVADQEALRNEALSCIESHRPVFTLYTDGSASDGTFNGGAAMVITSGPAHSPTVIDIWKRRGSTLTSSFEEEKEAMAMAVQWIISSEPEGRVLICSDSQSLLKAIANKSEDTYEVRAKLLQVKGDVVIQWVPGHTDIPGNEAADKAAKEAACITDDPPRPVSLASALSCVNRSIQDMPIEHTRTALVYKKINQSKDQAEVKSRKDAVFLAQIRSGHCLNFKAYQHLLNAAVDPTCPRCGEGPHTLEHWFLECVGTEATRRDIFGEANPSLEVLTDHPGKAVLMSRRTL